MQGKAFSIGANTFPHCKVQTGLGGDWCHGPAREHGFQTHLGPGFPFSLSRTVDRGLPSCAPASAAMLRTNIDTHRARWSQEPSEQLVRATNGVEEGLTAMLLFLSKPTSEQKGCALTETAFLRARSVLQDRWETEGFLWKAVRGATAPKTDAHAEKLWGAALENMI